MTKRIRIIIPALALIALVPQPTRAAAQEDKEPVPAPAPIEMVIGTFLDLIDEADEQLLSRSDRRNALRQLENVERYVENGDFRNANRYADQLGSGLRKLRHPRLKELVQELRKAIDTKRTQQARELSEEGLRLMSGVEEALKAAARQDDLLPLIDLLAAQERRMSKVSSSMATARLEIVRQKLRYAGQLLKAWGKVLVAEEIEDPGMAIENLDRILSNASYMGLVPTKRVRAKRAELVKAAETTLNADLAALKARMAEAKAPEALAAIQSDFETFYHRSERSFRNHPLRYRLDACREALRYWADVLREEAAGEIGAAMQSLNNMENSYRHRPCPLLPEQAVAAKRATLTKRLFDEQATVGSQLVRTIDARIKTVRSIEELLSLQSALRFAVSSGGRRYQESEEIRALLSDLTALAGMQRGLMSGRYGRAYPMHIGTQAGHRWGDVVSAYYNQLALEMVAASCRLGKLQFRKPNQSVAELLLAMADKAAEKADWQRTERILDAYRLGCCTNDEAQPGWLKGELAACRAFLAGRNLEQAGQHRAAAKAYRTVLEQTGTRVPVKEATKRLRALEQTQPEQDEQ